MVVWCIVNVEEWDIHSPMPRTVLTPPAGGAPSPDIPNWAWHEYGNRVGFWRMLKVFDEFKVPATLAINGSAIAAYPQIVAAANERNWEFIGHGFTQRNMQKVEDERADIRRTREAITHAVRQAAARLARPRPDRDLGDAGPAGRGRLRLCLRLGARRPAGVAEDAQQPILNVPYTQECNDVAMMLIQHHPAREYFERARDQFEQIYADAADGARVMALVQHPYILGAPHRLKYFRADHRADRGAEGRAVLDRRADRGLVCRIIPSSGSFPLAALAAFETEHAAVDPDFVKRHRAIGRRGRHPLCRSARDAGRVVGLAHRFSGPSWPARQRDRSRHRS